MRARRAMSRASCAAVFLCIPVAAALADDMTAGPPVELAVTIYRAPSRIAGSIGLGRLNGFALVSETRLLRLPRGLSRLRFDGVADGIEAQSAIISGLPDNLIEKNRDAKVLSPTALLAAAVHEPVELLRTNPRTGEAARIAGTILSDAGGGVVFKTADGIEGLRCSGLPETFSFEPGAGPAARPSLSVLVRTRTPLTKRITLSYLSRGFDWAADYSATLSADAGSMDLGAWVTLANSNGTGFPSAATQVVAGRVNRESKALEPFDLGGPILASCWPRGSTSDTAPSLLRVAQAAAARSVVPVPMLSRALQDVTVTASRKVALEQLGDLKLYRVPERTTVAGRQSKQVRLLDRTAIPIATVYRAALTADEARSSFAAERVLRTVNDKAHHLGLPLPSGSIAVFALRDRQRLLLHESSLRDLAVNEELEIDMGSSADVQVAVVHETVGIGAVQEQPLPRVPGATPRRSGREQLERVRIGNSHAAPIQMELAVQLYEGAQVIRADHPLATRNGRPIFRMTIPALGSSTLRYQIQFESVSYAR